MCPWHVLHVRRAGFYGKSSANAILPSLPLLLPTPHPHSPRVTPYRLGAHSTTTTTMDSRTIPTEFLPPRDSKRQGNPHALAFKSQTPRAEGALAQTHQRVCFLVDLQTSRSAGTTAPRDGWGKTRQVHSRVPAGRPGPYGRGAWEGTLLACIVLTCGHPQTMATRAAVPDGPRRGRGNRTAWTRRGSTEHRGPRRRTTSLGK